MQVYTSSPGDSSIGLSAAALHLRGNRFGIDSLLDVNETAAYVLATKRGRGASAHCCAAGNLACRAIAG